MAETNPITTATFVIYVIGVMVLALLSHRVMGKREFMGEYFLGSRGMKSWTLAFAFAATATSAGSYIGFPALIYSYGWVLAGSFLAGVVVSLLDPEGADPELVKKYFMET